MRVSVLAEPSPPLTVAVVAPVPAPTLPQVEPPLGGEGGGRIAQVAIGGEPSPALAAAIGQIEQNGLGDQGNRNSCHHQAAAHLLQARQNSPAASRPNTDPPGQHHRVKLTDGGRRSQRAEIRPPGAPPNTATDATTGRSKTIAVTPEARSLSVA